METKLVPRGIRNNNPLNIIHSGAKWLGLADVQPDKTFCKFISMACGIRAAVKILRSYDKKGFRTVSAIIKRWCPDNTAPAYIKRVCKETGWDDTKVVNVFSRVEVKALLSAMTKVECANYVLNDSDYIKAFNMLTW